jgi:hypothetical protein
MSRVTPQNPLYRSWQDLIQVMQPHYEAARMGVNHMAFGPARERAWISVFNSWRWYFSWSAYWRTMFNSDETRDALGVERARSASDTRVPNPAEERVATLPNGFTWVLRPQGGFTTYTTASGRSVTCRTRSTHRVFLVCGCGSAVPAGRVHQHRCSA